MMPGPEAPDAKLQTFFGLVKQYYSEHVAPRSFNNMKRSMFTDPQKPRDKYLKLKGKAAEVKHLGPALLHAWSSIMDQECMRHKQIRLALRASVGMDAILDAHPQDIKLPPTAAEEFESCGFTFLACLTALGNHYASVGLKLFNITIKAHYLLHGVLNAKYINPRLGWCYGGEDYMHKMKILGQASCRATRSELIFSKMMTNYRWGMHFMMLQDAKWWK